MITDPAWSVGDRALLERVLEETGADTTPPQILAMDYLTALAEAAGKWLSDLLTPLGGLLHVPVEVLYAVAWVTLALVAVVLVLTVVRLVTARRRQRAAPPKSPVGDALAAAAVTPDVWAQELERRLKGADARAALEALWWWLARRLKGTEAEASWTTRELLHLARRGDLSAEGRVLDRLLYGTGTPAMTDVRGLALRLRRALA